VDIDLKTFIRDVPDFPKPGILFKDITPLLRDGNAFTASVEALARPYSDAGLVAVAAVEARGFIFAAAVAARLHCGFIPLRKPNKLPSETAAVEYALEYGNDSIEVHRDAIQPGDRVALIDDVLATGGTAAAAVRLMDGLDADLIGISFLIELAGLDGRRHLQGRHVHAVLTYAD
jgi:adenine phosphoribosyltransferase